MRNYLKTKGVKIVDSQGKAVYLNGVNFGGWLMMEAYFMLAPNKPAHQFKNEFKDRLGARALKEFENGFEGNFIREDDLRNIARMGFNCIRLPFNHRLVEKKPYQYDQEGLKIIDRVFQWAKKYKIWIILDLHAAWGSQNHDWHSDSDGRALLWSSREYQKWTFALWEFLADRYKDTEYLAGYDLLNESVIDDARLLNRFYHELIKHIRCSDKKHILFIEGNKWATDLQCLDKFNDNNYALSIHFYTPIQMTFNYVPHLKYPSKAKGYVYNKKMMKEHLATYQKLSKEHQAPVFVGEFGVNYRENHCGEGDWLKDILSCFNQFGFHWTYWTYKAIKNGCFPDGVLSYYHNPPWVHREGPLYGWDTYAQHWTKSKKDMIRSWQTSEFQVNENVLKVLKNAQR